MAKEVVPQLGLESFSCPHCGALAHQDWFHVVPESVKRDSKPSVIDCDMVEEFMKELKGDEDSKEKWLALYRRFKKNEITNEVVSYSSNSHWRMMNMAMSRCHSCEGFAVWIKDRLLWPAYALKIDPHPDMPADVKDDFVEAAEIVERSPRGSAALSRLIVQKLMTHLGGKGKDINANISHLVKNGLESEIQMALDIVRVTGNNAVHPGEMALKEDPGAALALLQLINLVVERRIATQKRIEEMFGNLPEGALEAIKKRDESSSS